MRDGTIHGSNHPWNAHGHLPGATQNSYRAELAAAAHVITTSTEPTHIVSDCPTVVRLISEVIENNHCSVDMEDPLWSPIRRGIAEKGNTFFSISWVKSHVSLEEAQTYIDQGTTCHDDFDRNEQADSLAKRGAQEHPVS